MKLRIFYEREYADYTLNGEFLGSVIYSPNYRQEIEVLKFLNQVNAQFVLHQENKILVYYR